MENDERQPDKECVFQTENVTEGFDENSKYSDEQLISQAEKFLENDDIVNAQSKLNAVREKSGQWHYIQGRVYLQMSWTNEARKQFELAIKAEPKNKEYIKALKRIKNFDGGKSLLNQPSNNEMDKGDCAQLCCECSAEACCLGICEGICDGCS